MSVFLLSHWMFYAGCLTVSPETSVSMFLILIHMISANNNLLYFLRDILSMSKDIPSFHAFLL